MTKSQPLIFTVVILSLAQNIWSQENAIDFTPLRNVAIQELKKSNTPGAAIAVIRGTRVLFSEGIGLANMETREPVTPELLFQIGSVTKTLTATVLTAMAEEGKLDLDEPIGKYVSGLNPKIAEITSHQLLNQTSGLKDMKGEWGTHDEHAMSKFLRTLNDEHILLKPGTAFSYSNLNFALAGLVIEEVAGKPYADVMSERLFKPLGMIASTFHPTEAMTHPLAMGHRTSDAGITQVVRPIANDTRLWPAGYAYCNLNDFSRFAFFLLNHGMLGGKQIIPSRAIEKMMTPSSDIPTNVFQNGKYGYAMFLDDHLGNRLAEHGGTMPGYMAELILVPSHKIAIVYLANNDSQRLSETINTALKLMLPGIGATQAKKTVDSLQMTEAEMQSYEGKYMNRWHIDLFVRNKKLFLRRFETELSVSKIGTNRFSVKQEGTPNAQEFLLLPASDSNPAYIQMLLWVFKKIE